MEVLGQYPERKDFIEARATILVTLLQFDSAPDYWAAVNSNGDVELAMCADDGNDGKAAREEVNVFINRLAKEDYLLHLVGLIKIDRGDLK